MTIRSALLLATALASVLIPGAAMAQREIGRAGAVNPASRATAGTATRIVELNSPVVQRERITTSGSGSVQVVFIDKTTLNIGPNSDIVIDEFVFDPDTNAGRLATTLTRGALRFVGGAASHSGNATIRTPAATLGVRGGVALVTHMPEATRAVNVFGTLTVTSKSAQVVLRRPDWAVTVDTATGAITGPERTSSGEVAGLTLNLSSRPGQTGGATRRPTDAMAARAGLGAQSVNLDAPSVQAQRQHRARTALAEPPFDEEEARRIIRDAAQTNQPARTAAAVRAAARQPRAYALTMSADPALGSGVPYLLGTFAATGAYRISPVYAYATPTPAGGTASQALQGGLTLAGTGAGQSSTLLVATAAGGDAGAGNGLDGVFRGSTRLSAGAPAGFAGGSITAPPGGVALDATGAPLALRVTGAPNASTLDRTVSYAGPPPVTAYGFDQTATPAPAPPGLGVDRSGEPLSGFVGGTMQTAEFAPGAATGTMIGPSYLVGGTARIALDPATSRVQADFSVVPLTPSGRPGAASPNDLAGAAFRFGGLDAASAPRSAFVDTRQFGAVDAASVDPLTGAPAPASTVNGRGLTTSRLQMVTSDTVQAASFFPGVTFCNCEFTRWGFWSSETARGSVDDGRSFSDRGHLNAWVAGRPPSAGEVPVSGTATYTGHVVASFRDGGANYVAAGSLTNVVDFGARSGTVAISGLDGRNYAGTLQLGADPRGFTGAGATVGAPGPLAAGFTLQGGFFRGSASPVQDMGGQIAIQGLAPGSGYAGSGIFAGSR